MTDGGAAHTVPVELVWPKALVLPPRPPRLVYLDLNHWIGLSKAAEGRAGGDRYLNLLTALDEAVGAGGVKVVLSGSLYWEMSKNQDPRQRLAYADILDRLTGFEYLCGLVDLMALELSSVMDELTGKPGPSWEPVPLVGPGVLAAFGRNGRVRIMEGDVDVTDQVAASGAVDVDAIQRRGERMFIEGPATFDMEDFRRRGYRPEVPNQSMRDNVAVEQHFADELLTDHWRRGRLRDVLLLRDFALELVDPVLGECARRGVTLEQVGGSKELGRRLVLGMPTRAVVVEMKTEYHKNPQRRWTVNDLHDIDALANSVPYCDVVFTDAAARNCLLRADLDARMNTALPRTPDECADLVRA